MSDFNWKADSQRETPEKILEPFVADFIKDRNQEIAGLEDSLDQNDWEALRKTGHRWKGFCAPYGFGGLEDLSIELEKGAETESQTDCANTLKAIKSYLEWKSKSQS